MTDPTRIATAGPRGTAQIIVRRAPEVAPAEDKYKYKYLIAIAVTLAAVLELIDTSIVNVAIPHMMGNLERRSTRSRGYPRATSSRTSSSFRCRAGCPRTLAASDISPARFSCSWLPRSSAAPRSLGGLIFWRVVQGIGGARCYPPRRRCSRRFRRMKSASGRRCSASA